MKKETRNIAILSATAMIASSTFIAAEPVVELEDSTVVSKIANPNIAPIGSVTRGVTSTVKEGKQKVLCLMINVDNEPFQAGHDEQYYSRNLFGSEPDSVKSFVNNQSGGKVIVEPADTKDSPTKGVLKINVPASKYNTIGANQYDLQKQIVKDALQEVKDKVDWAAMDQNNDKKFEESFLTDDASKKEELLVVTVISGRTASTDSTEQGKIKAWPHLTEISTTVNDYTFNNTSIVTSEIAGNMSVNKAALSHEYMHNLNARDMYKDENSIGPWSTMCDTYGKRPGVEEISPTPLDPVHKIYMGWATPKPVTKGTEVTYKKNEVPYIVNPKDSNIIYLLDYRDYSDENQKALNKVGVSGDGMVVWKINKEEATRDWLHSANNDTTDWYVNSKGPGTAMRVLAKGNGVANVENSYVTVNSTCGIDGTDIFISVKDKKMIIKGDNTPVPPKPEEQKIIIDAVDREIEVGAKFDPLEGVKVRDEKNNILDKAKLEVVKSTVNINKEGKYTVTVKATLNGKSVEKTYSVTVNAKEVVKVPPVINAQDKVINKGDIFNAKEGVTATDSKGNDITASIKVNDSGVRTDVPGVYQVTYEVADMFGVKATKTIKVTVKDVESPKPVVKNSTPPVITGVKDTVVQVGDKIDLLKDISAKDDLDGNISVASSPKNIDTSKPGKHKVTYYAFDKNGNMASYDRLIEVAPTKSAGSSDVANKVAPEITLLENTFRLPQGNKINPLAFVHATDDKDGDLTDKIKILNKEDLSKPGTHIVKVSVKDSDGNEKTEEMKFIVEDTKSGIYVTDTTISVNDKFNPLEDIIALDYNGQNITNKIKVDTLGMDTSKPGKYTLKYTVTDSNGKELSANRDVTVTDSISPKPDFKFKDSVIKKGTTFNPLTTVETNDKVELLAGEVDTNTSGVYNLVYKITEDSGNSVAKLRRVVVLPKEIKTSAPCIYVLNSKINLGEKFNPKDTALVIDKEDGLINHKLLVESSDVDTNKVGRYTVKYSVVDSDANATSHVSNIDIVKPTDINTKPDISPKPEQGSNENNSKPDIQSENPKQDVVSAIASKLPSLPKTGTEVAGTGAFLGAILSGVHIFKRWFR